MRKYVDRNGTKRIYKNRRIRHCVGSERIANRVCRKWSNRKPPLPHPISNGSVNVGKGNEPIQRLTFDVALTTTEASSVDGGAKGGVAIFSAKVGTEQQSSSQNVSRLSFVIPVVLPVAEVMTASEKHSEACRQNLRKLRAEIDSGYADKTKAKQQPRESNMQLHQQNDLSAGTEENTCEANGGNAKG